MKERWLFVSLVLVLVAVIVTGLVFEHPRGLPSAIRSCQQLWPNRTVLMGYWDVEELSPGGFDIGFTKQYSLQCYGKHLDGNGVPTGVGWFRGDDYRPIY